MAAPIIAQHQTASFLVNSTCVASLPTASTAGNLLIAAGDIYTTAVLPTPSGWTPLYNENTGYVSSFGVFWKISTGEQNVTLATAAQGLCEMIEISGQAADSPLTAGTGVVATTSPITTNVAIPASGGLLIGLYASCSYNAPTLTLTSPSGQTRSTIDAGAAHGANEYHALSAFQTTSEPYSASQPYTDSCATNLPQYGLAGLLIWIAPAAVITPPPTGLLIVQHASGTSAGIGVAASATLGAAPKDGNLLLFGVCWNSVLTTPPAGSTLENSTIFNTGTRSVGLYSKIAAGDSAAWSATASGSNTALVVVEVSGQGSAWNNVDATSAPISGTDVPSASITPTVAGCLILDFVAAATSSATWTPGSPFANVDQIHGNSISLSVDSYQQTTAAAISETGTLNSAHLSGSVIVAIAISTGIAHAQPLNAAMLLAVNFAKNPFRTLVAALPPSANVAKMSTRKFFAALTSVGGLATQYVHVAIVNTLSLLAALSSIGAYRKTTTVPQVAAISLGGGVVRQIRRAITGTLTAASNLAKSVGKLFAGAVSPSSSIVRILPRALPSAALFLAGSATKSWQRRFTGALGAIGSSISRFLSRILTASVAPPGSVAKGLGRALAGSIAVASAFSFIVANVIAFAGTLSEAGSSLAHVMRRILSSSLSSSGAIGKSLAFVQSGATGIVAGIGKQTNHGITGILAITGVAGKALLRITAGSLQLVGTSLGTDIGLAFSAASHASGIVARSTSRILTGASTFFGGIGRLLTRQLTATLNGTSLLSKGVVRSISAYVAFNAILAKTIFRTFTTAGALAGAFITQRFRNLGLAGIINVAGSATKGTGHLLYGVLNVIGDVGADINGLLSLTFLAATKTTGNVNRVVTRTVIGSSLLMSNVARSIARTTRGAVGIVGQITSNYVTAEILAAVLPLVASVVKSAGLAVDGAASLSGLLTRSIGRRLSAVVTPVAVVLKWTLRKLISATFTGLAVVTRSVNRGTTGALAAIGFMSRGSGVVFSAVSTASAALAKSVAIVALTGASAFVANIGKRTRRGLAASAATITGVVAKVTNVTAFGAALAAGGNLVTLLIYTIFQVFGGTITPSSSIRRDISRPLLAFAAPVGSLRKMLARSTQALLAALGSTAKTFRRSIGGLFSISGTVAAQLLRFLSLVSGALNLSGRTTRNAHKNIAGALTASSEFRRPLSRMFVSLTTPIGDVSRQISFSLMGSTLASGAYGKGIGQVFTAVAEWFGAVARYLLAPLTPILHPYVMMATPIIATLTISTPVLVDAEE